MGSFKQIVTACKRLMTVDFLQQLATHVKARSLRCSANLAVDPAHYGPKQNTHVKKRTRSTFEKAQTEDFMGMVVEEVIVIPNGAHRKDNVTEQDAATIHSSLLDCPEEECEDFDEHAHRATPVYLMTFEETSPWRFACTLPRHFLHGACKHVICRAWHFNCVPRENSLSLEKLTQNKKRGRPRKLKGKHALDE